MNKRSHNERKTLDLTLNRFLKRFEIGQCKLMNQYFSKLS